MRKAVRDAPALHPAFSQVALLRRKTIRLKDWNRACRGRKDGAIFDIIFAMESTML